MELTTIWFIAIAVLFTGYFILEGFDFGVGILLPVLGREDRERRAMINTIGPLWDGNEVWIITAGGAMFAAFPHWYASLFSGFYLLLFAILVGLIVRGVAFEYRGKGDTDRWRRNWDICIVAGSALPAFFWGVVVANLVRGVPLDANFDYTGSIWGLLNGYALLGGLTTLLLFATHGAYFLHLRTTGDLAERARAIGIRLGAATAVPALAFLIWTQAAYGNGASLVLIILAVLALVAGLALDYTGRSGWAFAATALTIALASTSLFCALWPDVLPSTPDAANSLTHENAAATEKTLGIMTWAAVVFLPVILLYQGWTYWVFRKRVVVERIPVA
ncbi:MULTISPECIES: cytochrome d ubiquinol oxidase subunit II [Glycomyces]|uniref:Cytochrome d ubiquinol oxidase subunit II n=2 Tax=Glycomyces TaxID=58113 RepID=A0A9X3SUU0_9ACTN|nr:cytochrome d ubiquinol oxidase subunit II [Glycomyces lechevalierae]MDA1385289.1 cytochrome d ubiquinol oxidase subunit II [Glycomyces lechevalierae]MDR7337094.1 cytochrome d ubiquinol oxidase subunit II [Glycomyces lechevalierae]